MFWAVLVVDYHSVSEFKMGNSRTARAKTSGNPEGNL